MDADLQISQTAVVYLDAIAVGFFAASNAKKSGHTVKHSSLPVVENARKAERCYTPCTRCKRGEIFRSLGHGRNRCQTLVTARLVGL
jgi:hypothetical protein